MPANWVTFFDTLRFTNWMDRRRQHVVAGEHRGPFDHALVRGDQDRASSVAIRHVAEEETRLLARHRLEAHLVDYEQPRVHVLALA
jgi:hypothetical protein